ncbi:MAG: ankyrin repeat domain-containing protein [bacterium]
MKFSVFCLFFFALGCNAQPTAFVFPKGILDAVSNDDTTILEKYIKADSNLTRYQDEKGATLLFIASESLRPNAVNFLLNHRSDQYLTSKRGNNSIFWPIILNAIDTAKSLEIVRMFLKHGYDINRRDSTQNRGSEPLILLAITSSSTEILNLLISNGANVNETLRSNGATLLHTLAYEPKENSLSMIKLLIKSGADVNRSDSSGKTPLFISVIQSNVEFVNTFLGAGSNVNSKDREGRTPFIYSTFLGNTGRCSNEVGVVQQLIKYGAKINEKDNYGACALHYAAYWNCIEVVKLLIENNAEINVVDNKGNIPLHYATKTPSKYGGSAQDLKKFRDDKREITKLLLGHGANKNIVNSNLLTPYQLATQDLNYDVLDLLK